MARKIGKLTNGIKRIINAVIALVFYRYGLVSSDRYGYEFFIESGSWDDLFYITFSNQIKLLSYENFLLVHTILIFTISDFLIARKTEFSLLAFTLYYIINIINVAAILRFDIALFLLVLFFYFGQFWRGFFVAFLFHSSFAFIAVWFYFLNRINFVLLAIAGLILIIFLRMMISDTVLLFSNEFSFSLPTLLGSSVYGLPIFLGLIANYKLKDDLHFKIIGLALIFGFYSQIFTMRFAYMWLIFPIVFWPKINSIRLLMVVILTLCFTNLFQFGSIISPFTLIRLFRVYEEFDQLDFN